MALAVCRVGDTGNGYCFCHSKDIIGTVITGSFTRLVNNLPVALLNSLVLCNCGHVALMVTGSPNVLTNNLANVRMTDIFIGNCDPSNPTKVVVGTIFIGSPNVLIS